MASSNASVSGFSAHTERLWADSESALAVIVVGLDQFEHVEREYGRDATDRVCREIPLRFGELLPPGCFVAPEASASFLIAGRTTTHEAALLAEQLKVSFTSRPFASEVGLFIVHASFGVAARHNQDTAFEQIVERARGALQIARDRGGNRVEVALVRETKEPITDDPPRRESGFVTDDKETAMPLEGPRPETRWSQLPAFDSDTLDQLKELVDGDDMSFLDELYENYLASARGNLNELVAEGDREVKRRAAHTLKGSSLNVGATAVALACKELEQGLSQQPDSVDIDAWVQVIQRELDRVRAGWTRAIRSD